MAKANQTATQREVFLEQAQEEMIAFERKERAFKQKSKEEEAEALGLPVKRLHPQ
jgi:hypothetical protein